MRIIIIYIYITLQEANTKLDENRDDINAKLAPTFGCLRHIASCLLYMNHMTYRTIIRPRVIKNEIS